MTRNTYHPSRKVRVRGITAKLIIAGLVLLCILLLLFSGYIVVRSMGKQSLQQHASQIADSGRTRELSRLEESEEASLELKEGQILVDGEIYQYNEDIMTFLCMGIDSRTGITDTKTPGKAGQADVLLLMVANPQQKSIQVISINRDTMTNIETYDTAGMFAGEEWGQITLQYAYGDGRESSCRLMEKAISNLLYGMPIHGYGALDMESISTLNDAVGGIEVTIPEDMTKYNKNWTEGSLVLLEGKEALTYLQRRDFTSKELGTNLRRMERQKQYMSAFIQQLKLKTKEDITFPLALYNAVEKHMVTSFTADEITYLASTFLGYEFSMENILSLPGESVMGEKNEEYHVDDEALRQIIIEVFYEKVR